MEKAHDLQSPRVSVTTEAASSLPLIKLIRILLLVLIIIGIVLLCTTNFWVPKLVNFILGPQPILEPVVSLIVPTSSASIEGMEYEKARSIILDDGWKPWSGPCEADKNTCAKYPEINSCSESLPVYCGMDFIQKNQCLVVSTVGEAPPGFETGVPTVQGFKVLDGSCPTN
jgi:hypothetical protein